MLPQPFKYITRKKGKMLGNFCIIPNFYFIYDFSFSEVWLKSERFDLGCADL